MSEHAKGKGHCLCRSVQITAEAVSGKVGACHCDTCRKWCGGPFMAVDCGTEVFFRVMRTSPYLTHRNGLSVVSAKTAEHTCFIV